MNSARHSPVLTGESVQHTLKSNTIQRGGHIRTKRTKPLPWSTGPQSLQSAATSSLLLLPQHTHTHNTHTHTHTVDSKLHQASPGQNPSSLNFIKFEG